MSLLAPKDSKKTEENRTGSDFDAAKPEQEIKHSRSRRKPVHRTREEEIAAYGRIFEGCGKQSDYDITTKLGEGTSG